jgi:hypothetical protein
MGKRAVALMACGLVAALLVAGCGGGDDGDPSAAASDAPPISKAEFIKKADAICQEVNQKIVNEGTATLQKALKGSGESLHEAEVEVIATVTLPLLQEEIDELRALGAPSGDEDRVDAFVDLSQKVIDEGKADPERYQHKQVSFQHPFEQAEKLAKAYGVSSCPQI